ncbi:MAG: acyl-ACP--UDP-N-acetylglucosamine O-acyltransferase [Acidobacteria bacterium]|nr:MAG: acyl-ACP--UDP-N-acetylglucosamine O-acyltransferase [Acidobacteriota bacterium]REJ98718.1 MAG: acyl-ACP--UDP-N-acetylglucosamine O-acyltransferase [Acidobacteriota bacterium]REK16627.1 MAG: acyl-ACP--UDP-N-acetylglucosamine O-acyltransferase [Acidobacteriota bacterium]REK42538.1 MAG: acyl-ACP--UDP-N-acetylglucosamine O-acyltransferase [Acidobacteriota bacterium]
MSEIHPSSVVSAKARIGENCRIGPYAVIGENVRLGDGVQVDSHAVIGGDTEIGEDTRIFPFVSIGLSPQDLKYDGEKTSTVIGARNQIREFVTVHRGTAGGGGITRIGDDNLLMAQVHIAHDCSVGNEVIMANAATLAGHVEIDDKANVGAYSGVHQFCRVGREAFIGGYSVVVKDAMPFAIIQGNHAKCYGLNKLGMKRRGYPRDVIKALNHAFHLLLSAKLNTTQAVQKIRKDNLGIAEVDLLIEFIETSERGVVK